MALSAIDRFQSSFAGARFEATGTMADAVLCVGVVAAALPEHSAHPRPLVRHIFARESPSCGVTAFGGDGGEAGRDCGVRGTLKSYTNL